MQKNKLTVFYDLLSVNPHDRILKLGKKDVEKKWFQIIVLRKPFTVFVAVVLIILLGVISFTKHDNRFITLKWIYYMQL